MTFDLQRNWNMGVISNSETSMFQTCERKHFYGFGQRLQPKRMSDGLTRGIIGHEVLAEWYRLLKDEVYPRRAVDEALTLLDPYFAKVVETGDESSLTLLTQLKQRLQDYFQHATPDAQAWEILEIEKEYRTSLPSGMEYAMRLDLLVRPKSGPFMGELVLVDHKFVYDFYREDALSMNAQMPKYLGILNANGVSVRHAILNQIRTRVNKTKPMATEDMFRRSDITPTPAEIKNIFSEELLVANRIQGLRELDDPFLWESKVTRNMGTMTCPMCPYVSLCKSDLMGQDTRLQKMMDFEEPSYGYEESSANA